MAVRRNPDGTVTTTFRDGSTKTQSADGRTLVGSTPPTNSGGGSSGGSSGGSAGGSSGGSGGGSGKTVYTPEDVKTYGNRETAYTVKDNATGKVRTIYSNATRWDDVSKSLGGNYSLVGATTYGTAGSGSGQGTTYGSQSYISDNPASGGWYGESGARIYNANELYPENGLQGTVDTMYDNWTDYMANNYSPAIEAYLAAQGNKSAVDWGAIADRQNYINEVKGTRQAVLPALQTQNSKEAEAAYMASLETGVDAINSNFARYKEQSQAAASTAAGAGRQAYIDRLIAQRKLSQDVAASGAAEAPETLKLGLQSDYESQVNKAAAAKSGSLSALEATKAQEVAKIRNLYGQWAELADMAESSATRRQAREMMNYYESMLAAYRG